MWAGRALRMWLNFDVVKRITFNITTFDSKQYIIWNIFSNRDYFINLTLLPFIQ